MIRRLVATALALSLLVPVAAPPVVFSFAGCDPFTTAPEYDGTTPTATDVLGFAFGAEQVTAGDSEAYLAALDGHPRVGGRDGGDVGRRQAA